jgi:Terpene cyclase DEP1
VRERLLLALTVVGFVVPNVLLGIFLIDEGFDLDGYFSLWTASTPSTQLLLDLVIASLAFFVWAAVEGPRAGIARWWVCIPATLLVGLCFGLPLFFWMRERALGHAIAPQT